MWGPSAVPEVTFPLPSCPCALAGAGFVSHGEEEGSIGGLGDGAFACGRVEGDGGWGNLPCNTVVGAGDEAGVGVVVGVFVLCGKDEGVVAELDSVAGALEAESPRGLFYLGGDVDGFGPCEAVVDAFGEEELAGLFGCQAGAATGPAAVAF